MQRPGVRALLMALLLFPQIALAEVKEYVRDYSYQAEQYDTKESARVNAIEGVKRELLDELGTYVGSVIQQNKDSLGNIFMSYDVVSISAGIVALNVLDERWTRPVYYVKANMKADPDDVLNQLKAMRASTALEDSLRESSEALERSRKEVAQLKAQLAAAEAAHVAVVKADGAVLGSGAPASDDKLLVQYRKAVRSIEVEQAFQRAFAAQLKGDFDSLYREMSALADKGYVKAQLRMGMIYERGLGVPQDYKRALEWYTKALDNAAPDAPARIGWLYEHGFGVEKDYGKAAEYYNQAIADGSGLGYTHLGYLYETGKGVERNRERAAEYYRTGVEKGNYLAMARLGYLYQAGLGVGQDEQKAVDLYQQAVEHGQPYAMARLGQMYNLGRVVPLDHARAMALIRESLRYNLPASYALMGYMYENGWETKQDYAEAKQLYEKAAEMDAPFAERRLGIMYKQGLGVARDPGKARYWLERAANKGDDRAAEILARMAGSKGTGR